MKRQAGAALFGVFLIHGMPAGAVEQSLRPETRPPQAIRVAMPGPTLAQSLRPAARQVVMTRQAGDDIIRDFREWVGSFRQRALSKGISARTFDAAFDGVRPDPDIVARDGNQSEFSRTIWQYLDGAVSDSRIRNGKAAIQDNSRTLAAIESRYGVEKEVVAAIWGLESSYGSHRGKSDIVTSLATLAHDGRRAAFFEDQLIAALTIIQHGDIPPRRMTGSWAGAMGHTQFMPTSYLEHAVDFTGDGRRDIWSDDPADSLASTAAYLARFGWKKGQPWGVEVTLPRGFDYRLADRDITRMPSDWARLGIRDTNGHKVPDHGQAAILLPAGGRGAAFMIFDNFSVIRRYNAADSYALAVGHLSDRLRGKGPIRAEWPRHDRALTRDEKIEMQERLTALGFDTEGVDGQIGPRTVSAVRSFQIAQGMAPDGYASPQLLERLR
ncbi:lytic murein transglycosylase [Pontibaca methylaminivorans]|uniref:Lytic murein transglycosylase n=1 Tax=Pontibaca methylaminivorans TaxID=515897 RepID=A0A1R3WVL5_9RHOB|nr:lytic murein transglycosylase [Pontibaca methylaminivorans]